MAQRRQARNCPSSKYKPFDMPEQGSRRMLHVCPRLRLVANLALAEMAMLELRPSQLLQASTSRILLELLKRVCLIGHQTALHCHEDIRSSHKPKTSCTGGSITMRGLGWCMLED